MAEAFIISSEKDLWALLERALTGNPSDMPPPELIKISSRWRPHLLYFPDEPVGHSISPSMAKAVAGFHTSLSRSYAYMVYGQADARKLHADDLAALDIQMLAIDGSNGLDVLGAALDRLTDSVIHKLTGRQMAAAIAVFLLLYFSADVMKDWIIAEYEHKSHVADGLERLRLSEQETKRMQILKDALQQNPGMKPVASLAEEGRLPLVKSIVPHDRGKVLGVELTKEQAAAIISKEKRPGKGERLDGQFEVVELDVENPEGFMGTLREVKTGREIRVAINRGELPDADIEALFIALKEKATVEALVNAWIVSGKVAYAAVVRADTPKKG